MIYFNGIKNTLFSLPVFNMSFNFNSQDKNAINKTDDEKELSTKLNKLTDRKTLPGDSDFDLPEQFNGKLNVYLFIQRLQDWSAWNLIVPVIHDLDNNRVVQYGLGYFALQGCGGGLLLPCSTILASMQKEEKKLQ